MTLTPESRVLLTDALRPPGGYRAEIAVGTTYSLNLTALLLAPLSFALFDQNNTEELDTVDPIRLLEAVRRHADRTTVFCQFGGIHVPQNYRSILTFVEDSVLEVMPYNEGSIFHPKVWAIRFVDGAGNRLHRVIVLSRNMTLDRSWDTALVLNEADAGAIDAAPAADFVRSLPTLALRLLDARRIAQIDDLASSLVDVRLAAPSPFDAGELLPIGITDNYVWPFPDRGERLLAISPFLGKTAVSAISGIASDRTIVSRAESLELVGAKSLVGWNVNVLQRLAEIDPGADVDDVAAATQNGFMEASDGLHAKTFFVDRGDGRSMLVTGSANLTKAPWGTSVEFVATLSGPTPTCGVAAVLDGSPEAPGLGRVLEEYAVSDEEGATDAAIETSYVLERFHQQLGSSEPNLHIAPAEDDRVTATLTLAIPSDPPGETAVWLASLPSDVHAQPLGHTLNWTIAPTSITPFVAIETTAGAGASRVTRRCVIKASLSGAIDGRRQDAVFSILRSKADVLRYLVFLLGDPSYNALVAELAGVNSERSFGSDRPRLSSEDVAIFEPLVRATGRDEDALARVASLLEELRGLPDGDELVPDGFEDLWDVVWKVHQERQE